METICENGAPVKEAENAVSVRAMLLYEMQQGAYRYAHRLPRENDLADRLSISRTQLRDSLAQLEREGFITRRHGVGTLINRHVLDVKVRTDIEVEFSDMIRRSGYEPSTRLMGFKRIPADAEMAQRLCIMAGDEVLSVERLVLADNRPTIYCEDNVALANVKEAVIDDASLEPPIFDFLKRVCGVEPYMDITEIKPAVADEKLAKVLGIAVGTPLLYMDEVDYDIDGMPILYARQFYVDGIIKHTLMRKKF